MSKGRKIPGFCYTTCQPLLLTAAEWRQKYPHGIFERAVVVGETWYRAAQAARPGASRLVAEAYAVIPEGR